MSENGVISFNDPWNFSIPEVFPTNNVFSRGGKVIAPFWSDNDIRRDGAVRYTTYCTYPSGCDHNPNGEAILREVSNFLNENYPDSTSGVQFVGEWMLIAQWDHVHPSPHGVKGIEGIPPEELDKVTEVM